MFRRRQLRHLLESRVAEYGGDYRQGLNRFVHDFHTALGLEVQQGEGATATFTESTDDLGNPTLAKNRARAEEVSIRQLGEAIFGTDEFERRFDPEETGGRVTHLLEGPVDPTYFLNINAFSSSVAGLVEVKLMEQLDNPLHIGDQLMRKTPTNLNGQKMPRISAITPSKQKREPGQPHTRTGFTEEWIVTPELEENARAIEIEQEAVWYDLTGQVLERARGVGEILSYEKELDQLRLFCGVTNPYNYKGTTYNTYQTATPWINTHVNIAEDISDLDAALELLREMTDPVSGREILTMPTTVVYDPSRQTVWNRILRATEVRETTNTNTVSLSPPPEFAKTQYKELHSQILHNILVDSSDGLGLSDTNAKGRWWIGDPQKAFAWMEHHGVRVRQASPSDFTMIDRGIIAATFADYRGIGAVLEPRHMVENKQA